MKSPTWSHVKLLSVQLENASKMKESEAKTRLIRELAREISETIERLQGAA